jgi:hypothetical protein
LTITFPQRGARSLGLRIRQSAHWLQAKSPLKEIGAMAIVVEDALFHAATEQVTETAAREG